MIFVLYSEVWEDRLAVRDYLVSRFGMMPVEFDRAQKNVEKMLKEPLSNYVVWDALTAVDIEMLEYVGCYSVYITRQPDASEGRLFHFIIHNTDDFVYLRSQVMGAVIHFSELSGKMSLALRRGLEKSMRENL